MSTPPPPGQDPFDPRSPEDRAWDFSGYPESSAGARADDPLVPADFDGWVKRVIGVIRRSLVPLLVIQAGVAVISLSYQLLVGDNTDAFTRRAQVSAPVNPADLGEMSGMLGTMVVGLAVLTLVGMFAAAASIHIMVQDAAGAPTSVGAALGFALGRFLPLVLWGLVWWVLLTAGFILLFLPGVYLMIVFSAAFLGVVVIERGSIDRAFTLVNRRFMPTTGRILVATVAGGFYFLVTLLVAGSFGKGSPVGAIVQVVLGIPFTLAMLGVTVVTYAELRNRENPAIGTPQLAAELNR